MPAPRDHLAKTTVGTELVGVTDPVQRVFFAEIDGAITAVAQPSDVCDFGQQTLPSIGFERWVFAVAKFVVLAVCSGGGQVLNARRGTNTARFAQLSITVHGWQDGKRSVTVVDFGLFLVPIVTVQFFDFFVVGGWCVSGIN